MALAAVKLHIFMDNNIADPLGKLLQRRGHSVQRQRYYIPDNSSDPVVAITALMAGRILLTQDRDFNSQRFHQDRFAKLSRISLAGDSSTLSNALKQHMRLIEFQWGECLGTGSRMIVHIKEGQIRFRT